MHDAIMLAKYYRRARNAMVAKLLDTTLAPEIVRDTSEIIDWPEHSYVEPLLLRFGREPSAGKVSVGKYCSINGGTRLLLGGNHHTEWVSTYPLRIKESLPGAYEDGQPYSNGDISIGSDVWIAYNVIILSGVTIGHGAVIGAGSVVTRDVPPYALAAGNPAKVRRHRFEPQVVQALLRIAWWDWPHEQVIAEVNSLCSADISGFIERFDVDRS